MDSTELLRILLLKSNSFILVDFLVDECGFSDEEAAEWLMRAGSITNAIFDEKGKYHRRQK